MGSIHPSLHTSAANINTGKTLAERAILIRLASTKVRASARDDAATALVEGSFGVTKAGQFNKRLLKGSARFENVQKAQNEAIRYWHESTVPWMDDGFRLLPADKYLDFTAELRSKITALDALAADLRAHWATEVADDVARLGSLGRVEDYPTDITGMFTLEVRTMPVPSNNDWRVQVSDADRQALDESIAEVEANVAKHLIKRVMEHVARLAARLEEYKGEKGQKWHGSLVTNLSELLAMVPDLNINDDPEVEALVESVAKVIEPFKDRPEALKHSETARANAKAKLDKIMDSMDVFFGAE